MNYLPELKVNLSVQLNSINYLEEQITVQIHEQDADFLLLSKDEAFTRAITSAFEERGYQVDYVHCIFRWTRPGSYLGKSWCKASLKSSDGLTYTYQAMIQDRYIIQYSNRESFGVDLHFEYLGQNQAPANDSTWFEIVQDFSRSLKNLLLRLRDNM